MVLDHINFRAADQEAMRDFLAATLGLAVGAEGVKLELQCLRKTRGATNP